MSLQIKTIKFVSIIATLLAVCTYLVTINIELGFIKVSSPWISNNFVLTVFGGAFASMLVVLVCEAQKYHELKKHSQDQMFRHIAGAYIQIVILQNLIQQCLQNTNELIPKGILDAPAENLKNELLTIGQIEYRTFSYKSKLEVCFTEFCNTTVLEIISFVNYINYLTIAINTDTINNLELLHESGYVTSASPTTNKVLIKLEGLSTSFMEKIEKYLHCLDDQCGKRFNWDFRKMAIQVGCQCSKFISFEEFIAD